jgi:hypothetical protein
MCKTKTATAKQPFPNKQTYANQPVDIEYACLRCFIASDVITVHSYGASVYTVVEYRIHNTMLEDEIV